MLTLVCVCIYEIARCKVTRLSERFPPVNSAEQQTGQIAGTLPWESGESILATLLTSWWLKQRVRDWSKRRQRIELLICGMKIAVLVIILIKKVLFQSLTAAGRFIQLDGEPSSCFHLTIKLCTFWSCSHRKTWDIHRVCLTWPLPSGPNSQLYSG